MNNVKYTFLLPAYKARFLKKALESIHGQSLTDFKVIISDDCSPEDLYPICKPYLADSRFLYRRNSENIGGKSLVQHWNILVDLCESEYLIMASDDDVYDERFLEEIDRLSNKYPKLDLIRSRVQRIDEEGDTYAEDPIFKERETQLEFLYNAYNTEHIHCIANYVFKTDWLKKYKFVDLPLAWFSDDATVMLASHGGVANTSNILFSFRYSDVNISNGKHTSHDNAKKKIEATIQFHNIAIPYINQLSFSDSKLTRSKRKYIYDKVKNRIFWQIGEYLTFLNFTDFRNTYHWLCSNNYINSTFDKIIIWYRWCKLHK